MEELIFIGKPLINSIVKLVTKTYYSAPTPGRKLQHKLNDIIEGILNMCKTGSQVNFVNYKGIPGSVLIYHFYKWTKDNIFKKCWEEIYNKYQSKWKYNRNLKHLSIDCTKIKSINGNDCIGRNSTDRGRNGTHLSVIVDLIGIPVGYFMEPANVPESKMMDNTFKNKIYKRKAKSKTYSDKAYSSRKCISIAKSYNIELVGENKKNFVNKIFPEGRKRLEELKSHRYVVEAHFSWLRSYKHLTLRYDRYIKNYEGFLLIAFSLITCHKMISYNFP